MMKCDRFALNGVDIKENPKNWAAQRFCTFGTGCGWPPKNKPRPKYVTTSNLVILNQRVSA